MYKSTATFSLQALRLNRLSRIRELSLKIEYSNDKPRRKNHKGGTDKDKKERKKMRTGMDNQMDGG